MSHAGVVPFVASTPIRKGIREERGREGERGERRGREGRGKEGEKHGGGRP